MSVHNKGKFAVLSLHVSGMQFQICQKSYISRCVDLDHLRENIDKQRQGTLSGQTIYQSTTEKIQEAKRTLNRLSPASITS